MHHSNISLQEIHLVIGDYRCLSHVFLELLDALMEHLLFICFHCLDENAPFRSKSS